MFRFEDVIDKLIDQSKSLHIKEQPTLAALQDVQSKALDLALSLQVLMDIERQSLDDLK